MADTPITREEQFLSAAAGNEVNLPTPITREEMYLAKAAGVNININVLDPITRREKYLAALAESGGGGSSVEVEPLSVTENGTYSEEGVAYSPVTVNVPNSYAAADEGKVVSNGALVAQTAHAKVTTNGTIDTTLNNSVEIDVSSGGGGASNIVSGTFTPSAEGAATINLSYSGNGYPVAVFITVDGGVEVGGTTWYTTYQKNAIAEFMASKSNFSTAPRYDGGYVIDKGFLLYACKTNSSGSGTAYSLTYKGSLSQTMFSQDTPSSGYANCLRFSDNKTLKYYASATDGTIAFMVSIPYDYVVLYSE